MRKVIEVTTKENVYICDVCHTPHNRVKACVICGIDVCSYCAIMHDFICDLRKKNNFDCDYPDFICPDCWEKGESIRNTIQDAKNALEKLEDDLMKKWKELGKSQRNSVTEIITEKKDKNE